MARYVPPMYNKVRPKVPPKPRVVAPVAAPKAEEAAKPKKAVSKKVAAPKKAAPKKKAAAKKPKLKTIKWDEGMTQKALYRLAKDAGLKVLSKDWKEEIVRAIKKHNKKAAK